MDEITRKRLEHNEALFRSVNEEIDDRGGDGERLEYVCECSDQSCSDVVPLRHEEYRGVRSDPNQYLVVPGHERGDLEEVVDRHERYLVVRKF